MADHCKTGCCERTAAVISHVDKFLVHLVRIAGSCGKTAPAIALRCYNLSFSGQQMLVVLYISLYCTKASLIPGFLYTFKTDG